MASEETFTVVGMTCDHCVQSVSKAVGAVPGVDDVSVDLSAGLVTVASAAGVPVGPVRAAIEEAGFSVAGV